MRRSLLTATWLSGRAPRGDPARARIPGRAAGVAAAAVALSTAVGAGMPAAAVTAGPTGRSDAAASVGAARTAARAAAQRTAGRAGGAVAPRPVLLINGDRVVVRRGPGGSSLGTLLPPASAGLSPGIGQPGQGRTGRPVAVTALTAGGHRYVIPDSLLPYLSRGLDMSLFDLSALQRAETSGRLPVRITYRRHLPDLPGLHVSEAGAASGAGGHATGYLTAASARLFGAALSRQHATGPGHDARSGGLLADGASISLAGTAAPTMARTGRHLHTLTVTGTNLAGRPDDNGTVFVSNVDNSRRFVSERDFTHGTATFKVPSGHYWAVGIFIEGGSSGPSIQQRVVILPQFTVSGSKKVRVAERAASSKVTMVTPRPATVEDSDFEARRLARSGPVQFWAFSAAGLPLWISPASHRVTVGKLQTFTAQQLISPASAAGPPYEYNLAYRGPAGIIPSQRHVVRPSGLAVVDARYFQDVATAGGEIRFGMFRPQLHDLQFEPISLLRMPRRQTEYMTGNPAISWFDSVSQCYPSTPCPGGQNDAARSFQAGQRIREDWNAYPLHPAPNVNLDGAANPDPTLPSASRAGNRLTLDMAPFGDSQPGHTGAGFSATSYEVGVNGKQIASGSARNDADLRVRARLTPRPAAVRFALSASRTGRAFPLSARTRTVWTWRSVPRPRARLPRGWTCAARFTGAPPRRCSIQPMLTLRYAIPRLALDGSAPSGRQALTITAGHLPLARAAAIAAVRALVSFDGGRHWRPAAVARRGGARFAATFTAPAGAYVTLRFRAVDRDGGTITETIYSSYRTRSLAGQARRAGQR